MTYSNEDVRRLLKRDEDSELEFKEVIFRGDQPVDPEWDVWADEIAAFANTRGGAILCGVNDDGGILGLSWEEAKALEQLLLKVSHGIIKPRVLIRTYCREPEKDRRVLLVEVPRGFTRHDSPGGSFIRAGSRRRRLSGREAKLLAQRLNQAQFRGFDDQAVPNTGIGTLDSALWEPLLRAEDGANPEVMLEKLALLTLDKNGTLRATTTGILLCSKHPEEHLPNACITAIRYRGEDRASGQVDAQEISGPLDRQIVMAVNFVIRNMSVTARETPEQADLPQYSVQAVFEALVNAVVHRDYAIRASRICLSIFPDRLELQSPGNLPDNLTIKNIGDRQVTRNVTLASLLSRIQVSGISGSAERGYLLTQRGDGAPTIRKETLQLCGRPPRYDLIDGAALRLTIPAAAQDRNSAHPATTQRGDSAKLAGENFSACSSAIPDNTGTHPAP